jgi:hypothetical protein
VVKEAPAQHGPCFVELNRMPAHAIGQVYAPVQRGGDSISIVLLASDETADPADGNPHCKRHSKEVARAALNAGAQLGEFDRERAPRERADDGLAAQDVPDICPPLSGQKRIFEPIKQFGADCRASTAATITFQRAPPSRKSPVFWRCQRYSRKATM